MKAFLRKRTSSRAPPPDHQTSSVQTTTPVAPIETPLYARFAKTSLTEPAPAPTRPVVSGPMPLGQRPSMDTARDDKRKRTQSARTRTTSTSQASSRLPTPARSPAILSPMSSGPSLPEQNSTSSSTTTSYFAHSRSATSPDEFSSRLASAQSPMSSRPALRDDRSGLASSATPRQTNARALPEGPNLIPPPSISSDAPRIPSAILPEESTLRFLSLADSGFFDSPSRNEKPLPSLTPPKSSLSLPQSASSSQRTIPSNQSDTLSQYLATPPPASSVPNLMSRTRKTTLRPNDEAKTEAPARSLTALASPRKTQHALPPERGRASEEARVGRDGLGSAVTTPPSSSPPNSARLTASAGAFSVTTLRAGDRMAKAT
ncbi:hypothetical protein DENSPDRAFT_199098 [Dentipellis sp. KUC8613]|nr:hypothetical protein DENSPDRAFT_199098 [Dentipellis sp. KUC8613]